MADLISISLNW